MLPALERTGIDHNRTHADRAAIDEHAGHSSWSATWRFTHRWGERGVERRSEHGEDQGQRKEIKHGREIEVAEEDHGDSGRHGRGDQAGRMPCELVICPGRQITARSQPRSHVPSLETLVFTDQTAHLRSSTEPYTGSGKNRERPPPRKRVDRGPGGCVLITRPADPAGGRSRLIIPLYGLLHLRKGFIHPGRVRSGAASLRVAGIALPPAAC